MQSWIMYGIAIYAATMSSIEQQKSGRPLSDSICGPRCVQRVLATHGVSADLLALVREMQWPDFHHGSSLRDVSEALLARGIGVSLRTIGDLSTFDHDYPAIALLPSPRVPGEGHFVVVMSTEDGPAIWDGLNGVVKSAKGFIDVPIVLTFPKEQELIPADNRRFYAFAAAALFASVGLLLGLLSSRRLRGLFSGVRLVLSKGDSSG